MDSLYTFLRKERGGFARVARAFNISTAAVSQWFSRGQVPARFVLSLEKMTGVSRHLIRPDIYPVEEKHQMDADRL